MAKIVEGRKALAAENRAKRTPRKIEKQPKRSRVEAINEKRKELEAKQSAMQAELRKIRDISGKNEAYYDLSAKIDKYAGLLENYSLNPEVEKGQKERYQRRQEQFEKEMEAIFAKHKAETKKTPEYKGKSVPFKRKEKIVEPTPVKSDTPKTPKKTTIKLKISGSEDLDNAGWDVSKLEKFNDHFATTNTKGDIISMSGFSLQGGKIKASEPSVDPSLKLSDQDVSENIKKSVQHLIGLHKKEFTSQLVINTKDPRTAKILESLGFESKPSVRDGRDAFVLGKIFD
jgi:hypothetical protein